MSRPTPERLNKEQVNLDVTHLISRFTHIPISGVRRRIRLLGVNESREFDGVSNEEDWRVVESGHCQ